MIALWWHAILFGLVVDLVTPESICICIARRD